MASPADQRLLELLDKWLASLELHAKYAALDDDSYWKVQPWIDHQRPSRWIIDLAKQRIIALKSRVDERIREGDLGFTESLEQMIFLANLVGAEHIERFIPLAEAHNERALTPPETASASDDSSGTREMPKMLAGARAAAPPSDPNELVARVERRAAAAQTSPAAAGQTRPAAAAASPGAAAQSAAEDPKVPSDAVGSAEQVVSDAVRLVQWGRKWFELPELIARMAGRPPLAEVRRILKANRLAIDARAAKT